MQQLTRWGFLGIGRVTPRMVEAVQQTPGHQIVSVAARDASKLQEWADRYSVANNTTRFDELIESSDVDIVYNALPPLLHADWSIRAMRAGKHVLCEKPLACSLADAIRMREASEQTGRALWHATALAHHPRSQAMRDVVRSGELGVIRRVTIACTFTHVLRRGPDYRMSAELGGGCLLDLGWYCAFTTMWMTGLKPTRVQAIGQRMNPSEANSPWLSVQVLAQLENGATAHWDCGYDAAGRKWMEIAGSEASVICDDFLRAWDASKPRYWVHGHDGKARCELVGENVFQESRLVAACSAGKTRECDELLALGVETNRVLDDIESSLTQI